MQNNRVTALQTDSGSKRETMRQTNGGTGHMRPTEKPKTRKSSKHSKNVRDSQKQQ